MKSDKPKEAIEVFELNTKVFPNSWNVYDSYGELLKNLDKKTEAIKNYKKSVALNPGNQNGLKILEELGVDISNIIHKISAAQLKILEGEYYAENDEDWVMKINLINGILQVKERNMQYDLFPISDTKFVNQKFGASLEFNSQYKNAITFLYSGRTTFKKAK
jgi:tetratricopeptide (TPR) repeat protein